MPKYSVLVRRQWWETFITEADSPEEAIEDVEASLTDGCEGINGHWSVTDVDDPEECCTACGEIYFDEVIYAGHAKCCDKPTLAKPKTIDSDGEFPKTEDDDEIVIPDTNTNGTINIASVVECKPPPFVFDED